MPSLPTAEVRQALSDEGLPVGANGLAVDRAIELAFAFGHTRGWKEAKEDTQLQDMDDAPPLRRVALERAHQLQLKARGRFAHTPSDDELTEMQRLAMVTEEVGEVARECLALDGIVQEEGSQRRLYKELTQVAALCVAWLERA